MKTTSAAGNESLNLGRKATGIRFSVERSHESLEAVPCVWASGHKNLLIPWPVGIDQNRSLTGTCFEMPSVLGIQPPILDDESGLSLSGEMRGGTYPNNL